MMEKQTFSDTEPKLSTLGRFVGILGVAGSFQHIRSNQQPVDESTELLLGGLPASRINQALEADLNAAAAEHDGIDIYHA